MRTRVGLILIQIVKQKIQKQKHNMCKTKIQIGFYCKNKTRTKQGCNKKTYPQLMLNKLKIMWVFTFIYTCWALNSRNLL